MAVAAEEAAAVRKDRRFIGRVRCDWGGTSETPTTDCTQAWNRESAVGRVDRMPPQTTGTHGRRQAMTLTAAFLGWMFDGMEMGIFPLVARPALQHMQVVSAIVDEGFVQRWMGVVTAAFRKPRNQFLSHADGPCALESGNFTASQQERHAERWHERLSISQAPE